VTLAARVDSFHESTDGHIGIEYKEDIEKKIDKVRYLNYFIIDENKRIRWFSK
jgi:RNA processing factor Prp31